MFVLLIILFALGGYGIWEFQSHQQRLRKIPLRIHINGSRGKSSVTRLIAAGLRAGGMRAVAKTTGTLPRIIDHEGREIAINRNQPANIIEQVKILKYIDHMNPEVLVIECMAVLPEYQWFCEHRLVKSHIGVITNCRLDHVNEMGKFREQIARSLGNTIPVKGELFTSEKSNLNTLVEIAEKLNTKVMRVGGGGIPHDEMNLFSYIEHPANIGLALAVCEKAGVDRQTALGGMTKVRPDPGALRVAVCKVEHKEIMFVNAMAANDAESTLVIWNEIQKRFAPLGKIIFLLNSRVDRQDRSIQLLEMISKNIEFDYLALTGEGLKKFIGYASKFNIPKDVIVALGRANPEKIYEEVFNLIDVSGTVFAIGNVGGGGLEIGRYFYKHRRTDS